MSSTKTLRRSSKQYKDNKRKALDHIECLRASFESYAELIRMDVFKDPIVVLDVTVS